MMSPVARSRRSSVAAVAIAVAAAAFAVAALEPDAARADVSVPGNALRRAGEPEEIDCGGPEWTSLRRAVAAYCEHAADDSGCASVRRQMRTCDGDPTFYRWATGRYQGSIGSYEVGVARRARGFTVEKLEELCED